eukprot:CAMPEP_0172398328 /NCGR_PEP_ID=MMETSP1061-20121228/35391_1 /TAXON_ID=37318 /ORGANISM="Pseudo-nitzschia pungens, Strain cf. pungens" /LENGTH=52 /DNA_ID=CAMNT_0013130771 /DNA_START=166 /DNA_END=324 /DNA_ORIENTATION=+
MKRNHASCHIHDAITNEFGMEQRAAKQSKNKVTAKEQEAIGVEETKEFRAEK